MTRCFNILLQKRRPGRIDRACSFGAKPMLVMCEEQRRR